MCSCTPLIYMDILDFKKQFFNKGFLPRWVGIDACFCFCAALISGQKDNVNEGDDTFSVIDLSSRLDSYPAPTDDLLRTNNNDSDSQFAINVDRMIRELLESGAVRVRARDEFWELDYDYTKYRSESDLWESDTGKYWDTSLTINYQNRLVTLHNDPEDYLESCIIDYDYRMQTSRDGELIREVQSAIVDIEVSSEDLIASLLPLIETYKIKDSSTPVAMDIKAVTGTNRFFYSDQLARWISEFNGKVETYTKAADSKPFERIHYLLSHPVTVSGVDYPHLYGSVDMLGFGQVYDEHMEAYLAEPDLLHESSDESAYDDAATTLELCKNEEAKYASLYSRNPTNASIKQYLDEIRAHIKTISFKGKPKAKTETTKLKNKLKTTLERGLKELESDLQEHLRTHIQKEKQHIYYCANITWTTEEG